MASDVPLKVFKIVRLQSWKARHRTHPTLLSIKHDFRFKISLTRYHCLNTIEWGINDENALNLLFSMVLCSFARHGRKKPYYKDDHFNRRQSNLHIKIVYFLFIVVMKRVWFSLFHIHFFFIKSISRSLLRSGGSDYHHYIHISTRKFFLYY